MNEQDSDDPRPLGLLGGDEHFIDIPEDQHEATRRSQRLARQESTNRTNPHRDTLQHVFTRDLHHPRPFDT